MIYEMMDEIVEIIPAENEKFTIYTRIVSIGDYYTEKCEECVAEIKNVKRMIENGKVDKVYRVINADRVEFARKAGYKVEEDADDDDLYLMEIDLEKEYTEDFHMIDSSRIFMYSDTQKRM